MNRTWELFASCVLSLLMLSNSAGRLAAQTVLEKLENKIRQRVEKGAKEDSPPPSSGAPFVAAADPSAAKAPETPTRPGYMGVLADDRQDRGRGVRILDVYAGSPAERAGVRKQDLVTGVGDVRVRQMTDLAEVLALYAPGETVELTVLRGNTRQKLNVTLGRQPEKKRTAGAAPEPIPAPPAEAAPGEFPAETLPVPRLAEKPSGLPGELPQEPALPGEQGIAGPSEAPDLILPPPQEKSSPATQAKIEELQKRIQQLERRVQQLERELAELKKKQP
jgi:hypothetical protein